MVTISIVMTNKNGGRTLEKCILSALNQTIRPLEIVIVDAASADDSASIAKKYSALGVRFIVAPNCTVAEGETLAEQLAIGDYVAVTNPDVYVRRDWLERSYAWILKGYDIVGGIKVNIGDAHHFAWTALPEKTPWHEEKYDLGLTSMSTFAPRGLLLSMPIRNILQSRDVETALVAQRMGLKMVIDPAILVLHDEPLGNQRQNFRKSASYTWRHTTIVRSIYGKVMFGGNSGIDFSPKRFTRDLALLDAMKVYMLYKPILESEGINISPIGFLLARFVHKLGQVFGVVRGIIDGVMGAGKI